jgi:MSHA biogenesis protein MshI
VIIRKLSGKIAKIVCTEQYIQQKDNCVNLSEYKAYANKIQEWARPYLRNAPTLSTTQSCCINIDEKTLSIIGIQRSADLNEILFKETLKYDDLSSLKLVLSGLVEKHDLQLTPVYWLLNPHQYELNLMDSLPVPKDEFKTALSWRIRSLIKYPIEDAALEYFELPAKKNAPNLPLIAAVTAHKSKLLEITQLLQECNLQLTNITIAELAMTNLTSLYENDEKSTAFLYFYDGTLVLNISYQKYLYLTRRITLPRTSENAVDYEKLSLEIMRYFDFFRSQWRLSAPARIFISKKDEDAAPVAKALSERLLNAVVPYKLNSTLINNKDSAVIDTHFLLDYGCLLRKEGAHAAPGN